MSLTDDILMHYGMPRRSGRYPWGSGDNPYQHSGDFLSRVEELKKSNFTFTDKDGKTYTGEVAIAKSMGLSTTQFRTQMSLAKDERRSADVATANVDQTARSFIQDVVISMFDEGSVAIVPVDTTTDPNVSGSYDIQSLRVGQILDWYPQYIRTRVYNEQTGRKEDIVVPKSAVAIIENPLYAVINEPNSTMQRLIRKLNLLDVIDEQSGSGKLDLIIQLPYVIKTEARRQQAENRRKDIESQLSGSKYGIAYTDGTEHITQLNRSVNNNLMSQIEYLTSMLYSQLGITQSILDGTADEKTMLNYNNRTIEPIISAIVDEMKRKFLTKTARSQRQSISFFRDPFKLVPVNEIAEIADKFTRNEIMTSNEIRQVVGMKPSDDPRADELRNKNLSEPSGSDQQSEEAPITTDNSVEESASDLDDKISKQKSKK